MQLITFKDVFYKGRSLFDCLITKDMNLEEALKIYGYSIKEISKSTSLDQVRLNELGLSSSCDLTYENLLTEVLNTMIATDTTLKANMAVITQSVANITKSVTTVADEKVKASSTDTAAGFLADKIKTQQPGTINYEAGKLTLMGFVPLGAVMYINKSRLADFDGTGKGKDLTDVWGWAICNGDNGTVNRLTGQFPRYAPDLASPGNQGGAAAVTLGAGHIPTLEMTVTGVIHESLSATQQFQINYNLITATKRLIGDQQTMPDNGDGQTGTDKFLTLPANLRHNHAFDLQARRSNVAASFAIIPPFLYEIPIERISV